jgi:hypothetical protein
MERSISRMLGVNRGRVHYQPVDDDKVSKVQQLKRNDCE